jgi:hypothetical protein
MVSEIGSVPGAVPAPAAPAGSRPAPEREFTQHVPQEKLVSVQAELAASRYAHAQEIRERLNMAALGVRQSYQTLDAVERLLGEISSTLSIITKQYPPYPIDNPERIQLLNKAIGMRKQIEALMYPPPDRQQALSPEAIRSGLLDNLEMLGPDIEKWLSNTTLQDTRKNMPPLPQLTHDHAEDVEIVAAKDLADAALKEIGKIKTSMWEDVVRFSVKINDDSALDHAKTVAQAAARQQFRSIGANIPVLTQT